MDHHDFVPCDVLPYSLKWFNYLSNITLYPIERVQKTAVTLKFCRRRRRKFLEKRSDRLSSKLQSVALQIFLLSVVFRRCIFLSDCFFSEKSLRLCLSRLIRTPPKRRYFRALAELVLVRTVSAKLDKKTATEKTSVAFF